MTQEEKQEVLVAICGYLPYGLKLNVRINPDICSIDLVRFDNFGTYARLIEEGEYSVKPYLRKLSSMTTKEEVELREMTIVSPNLETSVVLFKEHYYKEAPNWRNDWEYCTLSSVLNWLNAHHFDYRGLIEKGLALEAPENMY